MKILTILIIILSLQNKAFAQIPEFNLQIKNHKFVPEILEVPSKVKFKLIIENHDETAVEFESHDLNKEKIITARKKATIIITPLEVGEYSFFDDFHSHETRGKLVAK